MLENDTLELYITFEPHDIHNLTWFRNNKPLKNDDCEIENSEGFSKIKVLNVDKKKVGRYEVIIEKNNVIAKSASSIKLLKPNEDTGIEPPVFTRLLRPTKVCLNDILMVETEVMSNPCASFQWFIGTTDIASFSKQHKLDNICITTKNNVSCLCIENVNKDFIGLITCRAENVAGSVSCSATMLLKDGEEPKIGDAPTVVSPLNPITVMDGEPIELTCKITGTPWPQVDWYHDEGLIKKARDVVMARQQSGLCEIRIKEAFPEMSGTYKCVATNEFGSCSTECLVDVEGSSSIGFHASFYCMFTYLLST